MIEFPSNFKEVYGLTHEQYTWWLETIKREDISNVLTEITEKIPKILNFSRVYLNLLVYIREQQDKGMTNLHASIVEQNFINNSIHPELFNRLINVKLS